MTPKFSISDLLDPEKMKEHNKEIKKIETLYYRDAAIVEKRGRKKKQIEMPEENLEALNNEGVEDDTLIEPNENE